MITAVSNLWYRGKDPTRLWHASTDVLEVDVVRCSICGVAVGGKFEGLRALGPSDVARGSARGYPEWRSKGVHCTVEEGLIGDVTIVLRGSKVFRPFGGRFLADGKEIGLSGRTTPGELVELLGEPFGRSDNDWDDAVVLFYEFEAGEAQFAFGKDDGTLDSIEFWYEPELSQAGACETYGIPKAFPANRRRKLPE